MIILPLGKPYSSYTGTSSLSYAILIKTTSSGVTSLDNPENSLNCSIRCPTDGPKGGSSQCYQSDSRPRATPKR